MTVSTTLNRIVYTGNGSSTTFAFPYKFIAGADIKVYVAGVLQTTGYTVGTPTDTGANVTFSSAPATGASIVLVSDPARLQSTSLPSTGPFPAKSVETMADKLTLLVQRLYDLSTRSLTLSDSDVSTAQTTLPSPAANNILGWNGNGTGLQNVPISTLATAVTYGTANSDVLSGNGVQTSFTLSGNPGALNNLDVSIGGVTQRPGIDYTWASGTTITFTTAPVLGTNNILVRYMQALAQGSSDAGVVSYSDAASYGTGTVGYRLKQIISSAGASLVGFLQSGTGAITTRTVQDKLRESVSVLDFGADKTGALDATSAFAAARDSGATRIIVPAGTYLITPPLTLTVAGQEWLLDKNATLSRNTGGSGSVVSIQASNVKWKGGAINGNNGTLTAGSGIDITGSTRTGCVIEDCNIYNCYVYGIYAEGPGAVIRNNTVINTYQIGVYAVIATGGADQRGPIITGNVVDQTTVPAGFAGTSGGIFIRGNSTPSYQLDSVLEGNVMYMTALGTPTPPTCSEIKWAKRTAVTGNTCNGGYIGISLAAGTEFSVSGNTCFAQTGTGAMGIETAQVVTNSSITGNVVDGNSLTKYGIQLSAAGTASIQNVVSGNTVRRVLATTGQCISVLNSSYNVIAGNNLYPAGAQAGIYAQSAVGVALDLAISGNVISGNGTATYGIQIDTPIGCTVTGNQINTCVTAISLSCSTASTLDRNILSSNTLESCTNTITTSISGGAAWGNNNSWIGNLGFFRNGYVANILDVKNDVIECWGGAAPGGTVIAGVGSTCRNFAGGAATSFYVKESGAGASTGWVGK